MERKCEDWITTYLEYVKNTESPISYHLWTAFATLGAANGHNKMNGDLNYTMANNIYILLIAKQGKTRKTSAIEIGLDLLEEISQIRISPESVSKEKLFEDMSKSQNEPHKESNYVVYAGEFSSIINTSGIDMVNFLLRMFEKTKGMKNATLSRQVEEIKKPHITLMAATTPAQMRTGFGIDMRENGLMSRTALIYEDEPKQRLPRGGKKDAKLKKMLIHDLNMIAVEHPRRPLLFEEGAGKFYDDWYINILPLEVAGADNPLEEAFCSRKDLFLLKMSALCCISRDGDEISLDDMSRAMDTINAMQAGLSEVDSLLGTDKNLHVKEAMLRIIKEQKKVSSSRLTEMFFHDLTYAEWLDIQNHITMRSDIGFDGASYIWVGD